MRPTYPIPDLPPPLPPAILPQGVVYTPLKLTPRQVAEFRLAWHEAHGASTAAMRRELFLIDMRARHARRRRWVAIARWIQWILSF